MADVQVTCIIKPNPQSTVEHITHLGGAQWTWTREQVIASIDARTNTFFVVDPRNGIRANVRVVRPAAVRTYFSGSRSERQPAFAQSVPAGDEIAMARQPGLDDRYRDNNGQTREKNGNTRIDTLRQTYGDDFAAGMRGDAHLRTLLDRTGSSSLTDYLRQNRKK